MCITLLCALSNYIYKLSGLIRRSEDIDRLLLGLMICPNEELCDKPHEDELKAHEKKEDRKEEQGISVGICAELVFLNEDDDPRDDTAEAENHTRASE